VLAAVMPEAVEVPDSDGNGGGGGGGVPTARPLFRRSQTSTFLRNSGEILVNSWPGCASEAMRVVVAVVAVVVVVLLLLFCSGTSEGFFWR